MKRVKTAAMVILAFSVVMTILTGCLCKSEPKSLVIYTGMLEDFSLKAVQQFEKKTGIKTSFVRMSGGEILGRIRAEKDNPQASVWYGGPVDSFIAAKEEGLIEPYLSENASKIPKQYKDSEGYWTGIYVGYLGFICDGRFFREKNIKMPESWEDLLEPELKGQIMVAHPGSSGTAYTLLSTIVQLMGEKEGLEYMKKLDRQVRNYTKSGPAAAQAAGLGECAVGIGFMHDGIKYKAEGLTNIELSVPTKGTGYEIGAIAIIKGASKKEAAKAFVDWALTAEAQEIGQTVGSFQFLTNPDALSPVEADVLKKTRIIGYDFEWSGKNKTRLIEEWSKKIKE